MARRDSLALSLRGIDFVKTSFYLKLKFHLYVRIVQSRKNKKSNIKATENRLLNKILTIMVRKVRKLESQIREKGQQL